MSILKKGITGFDKPKEINEHTAAEIKNLITHIQYPFVVSGEMKPPNESSNYFRLSLINQMKNNKFDVLLNMYYWVMASVKTESGWMHLDFLEFDNQLKEQLLNFKPEIEILNLATLNEKPPEIEKEKLGKTEMEQIEYWKSKTYGEILFNGYD